MIARFLTFLAVGFLVAIVLPAAKDLKAAEAQAVREAVEEVFSSDQIQKELPFSTGSGEGLRFESDGQGDLPDEFQLVPPSEVKLFKLPKEVAEVLRVLFWAVMIIGLGLLVFFLVQELPMLRWRRDRPETVGVPGDLWGAKAGGSDLADQATLDLADRLAAEGRFGEAVHVLLLYSLQVLRRHLDRKLSPSLTAREIVGLVPLSAERRDDLRLLISAAELCHFGGRSASATEYRGCRETYLRFAAAWEA